VSSELIAFTIWPLDDRTYVDDANRAIASTTFNP